MESGIGFPRQNPNNQAGLEKQSQFLLVIKYMRFKAILHLHIYVTRTGVVAGETGFVKFFWLHRILKSQWRTKTIKISMNPIFKLKKYFKR